MKKFTAAIVVAVVLSTASPAHAQLVVWDVIAWAKDLVLSGLQDTVNGFQQGLNEGMFIINRRWASWASLVGYAISRDGTPPWKIFDWFNGEVVFFSRDFHKTLSYGNDQTGQGFQSVTLPRSSAIDVFATAPSSASEYLRTQLASVDLADAVIVQSADRSGSLRFAGRAEDDAITIFQTEALNETDGQGMNAVLGKLTAQSLIEMQNAQSSLTLGTATLDLLTIEAKRDREAHTAALNGQLNALQAPRDTTLDGTAGILSRWELP